MKFNLTYEQVTSLVNQALQYADDTVLPPDAPMGLLDAPRQEQGKSKPGYTGFLLIKCEHCGQVRGFCTKGHLTEVSCRSCGKYTYLLDMVPLYLKCKCGRTFKYMTNLTEPYFSYQCVACGAPVDLELSKDGTAYLTIGTEE